MEDSPIRPSDEVESFNPEPLTPDQNSLSNVEIKELSQNSFYMKRKNQIKKNKNTEKIRKFSDNIDISKLKVSKSKSMDARTSKQLKYGLSNCSKDANVI
eukprot:CAMPEP_0114584458 /NCGR_PEP_ID=MMETSP0125-20121206/8144_1 /TAXON_ID=485358 ORGANISM="Aristerostoma sp., Strain ATCC 50986" /NCGR_SAMPLE_ID=MMETSP0125 /ASSEMBLY_ACC=CAM_ASM_000245 /LENGTH=99 /DNA_ID=CAMNT_0001778841 /DNA_START=128 /DNA_END=427 /DNA_ORIENTATION=+